MLRAAPHHFEARVPRVTETQAPQDEVVELERHFLPDCVDDFHTEHGDRTQWIGARSSGRPAACAATFGHSVP